MNIKRGEIYLVNLNPKIGCEQGNTRPVLIIQNNIGNKYSPVTIIAPITSKIFCEEYPTNVFIKKSESKLDKDSTILLNQIRTIDKKRLIKKIGSINEHVLEKVEQAILISLGIEK